MRIVLALVLLLVSTAAAADFIARKGTERIHLSASVNCNVAAVLRHIPDHLKAEYRRADYADGSTRYFACWMRVPQGVHLWFEDGDQGFVPAADLKPAPEA